MSTGPEKPVVSYEGPRISILELDLSVDKDSFYSNYRLKSKSA